MRTPFTQEGLDRALAEAHAREGFGQISDELRQALCVLNLLDVRSAIEIGSENGGTISMWAKLWDPLHIIAVDMDSYGATANREARESKWRSWLSPSQGLDVVWGDSHSAEAKNSVETLMGRRGLEKVDLLFVDGDHSEAGAEVDFRDYSPLVRPGGLVLMADIHHAGRLDMQAHKFWERMKPSPIAQEESRAPHPRPNWQAFDIFHDRGRQRGFGFGFLFV
jgi:predicted O-methyltransferase YrrM